MKTNAEKFNWEGVEFPMQVDKKNIFEKNNPNYRINVCGYKNENVYSIRIIYVDMIIQAPRRGRGW